MTTSTDGAPLFALIMAGGAGTRFWPLSRRARPKQLLPLVGGTSLLAATRERIAPLLPAERILVATSADAAAGVRAALPDLPPDNLLVEPVGRDTAACIGWVAWRLARHHPGAVMLVVPADHVIPDAAALRAALAAAAATAFARGGFVTLGISPTHPATGFGYLELGEEVGGAGAFPVHRVLRFVEKPDLATATAMLAKGTYRWNAGMFAWRVGAIQDGIRTYLPELAAGLDALAEDTERIGEAEALARHYQRLPATSIDFGVMEKARQVWAVPVELAWSDVGSWPALEDVVPHHGSAVAVGDAIALDAEECVLVSEGPAVCAVGVRDLIVVATRDAVLVIPRSQAQRVKELVELLRARGRDDLL